MKVIRAILSIILAAVGLQIALFAGEAQQPAGPNATRFGKYTIEARYLEGAISGPWEFSQGVTMTGPGITATCENLKIWPGKAGQDPERAEATGKVVISGQYVAADKTKWKINGKATSASYNWKTGQGVLRSEVKFVGVNQATGATLTVVADKMIYEAKTGKFQFEKGAEPVKVDWEEPESPEKSETTPEGKSQQ